MKSKIVRRLWAAALTLVMAVSLLSPSALAEGTVNGVKEKEGTNGKIVVTVYDQTPGSIGTGAKDENLSKPVKDVGINALRIGDVVELTSTDAADTVTTQVAFGLTAEIAGELGLKTDNAIASENSVYYFEPTEVQNALSTKNEESGGQAAIENFVSNSSDKKPTQVTNEDGVATFSDLQYGLYLLAKSKVPSDATTDLVPFLVSVPMYVEDATTDNDWQATVYAYPKVRTGEITIAKTVDDGDGKDYADSTNPDIYVNASQTLTYTVTVNIPQSNEVEDATGPANKFDSFVITDTNANKTLDVKTNIINLTLRGTASGSTTPNDTTLKGIDNQEYQTSTNQALYDYYYEYDGKTTDSVLTITLTDTGLEKLNGQLDNPQTLELTYQATVATDVAFNTKLTNTATAAYHRVGMAAGTANASVDPANANVVTLYTYGIDLTKTLSDASATNKIGTQEISFVLYKNYANETLSDPILVNSANGAYWQTEDNTSPNAEMYTMYVTAETGKLSLYGLEPGEYYLKEVKTKTGYTLLEKPITIVITDADNANKATATIDGANAQITNGLISLSVENTKNAAGFTLPKTGGAGTLLASVIGLGLICAAVILLVIYRKKGRKNI